MRSTLADQLEQYRQAPVQREYHFLTKELIAGGKMMGYPQVSQDEGIQAHYIACRMEHVPHSLAEMFALAKPPRSKTDREFLAGHCNGNQFEKTPHIGDLYLQEAREANVDPTGKVYLAGLARFPGDPEAWISGRSDVKRVLEQRGWGCTGTMEVKAPQLENPPVRPALAEDIVNDKVMDILDNVPEKDLPSVDVGELRESVTDKLKPHWA